MELPISEKLNIGYLSQLFEHTTNCYKFFWFQAILNKLNKEKTRFTYDELINEMIADAWYMVTEYHLHLGPNNTKDNLEEVVKYISDKEKIPSFEKREKIITYLETVQDKKIISYKKQLIKNVPYRLQKPFYQDIHVAGKWDKKPEILTEEINRQERLLYYFYLIDGLNTVIEVSPLWMEYLLKNKQILQGWLQLHLIKYLQQKNPSVPGISDKLQAPKKRDVERVRKYWKLLIEIKPQMTEIYGDVPLMGKIISIDHFVPWQYVGHDELWNLHPTTKRINSKKSNALPTWKEYFKKLANMEYQAYKMSKEYEIVKEKFEECAEYHLNNAEIKNQLYGAELKKEVFRERLGNILYPVYVSAQNCGFREWKYIP